MDFDDTRNQAAFRRSARSWLEAHAEPRAPGDPGPGNMPEAVDAADVAAAKAWQKKKAGAGWACIGWPVEYGGRGATPIEEVIWAEEEARFRTPPDLMIDGHRTCAPTVMAHGSSEQKQRWLPAMIFGEEIWCQLYSEPGAGSDLAVLRTAAVRDGDTWVVNGQKVWTSHAQYSDWGLLLARHDPGVPKHAGLTCFVVDMHALGVDVRPLRQITGGHGFNEVFLDDVRVPDDCRLGGVGEGWRVAITSLMNERSASLGDGGVDRVRDLLRFMKTVALENRPAIEDPALRERWADFHARARGVELTGKRTLTALSRGETPGPEMSLMKLVSGRLLQEVAHFAMDLTGTSGGLAGDALTSSGVDWAAQYLGAAGLRIAGGTDEVLRNIIAERVLDLPREVRADKDIAFKDIPAG